MKYYAVVRLFTALTAVLLHVQSVDFRINSQRMLSNYVYVNSMEVHRVLRSTAKVLQVQSRLIFCLASC